LIGKCWNILQAFGIFYDQVVHFLLLWYIFSDFGNLYQEKSGNPVLDERSVAKTWDGSVSVKLERAFQCDQTSLWKKSPKM
jgi:hypothetical protein